MYSKVYIILLFLLERTEPRALKFLGKCSTIDLNLQPHITLSKSKATNEKNYQVKKFSTG